MNIAYGFKPFFISFISWGYWDDICPIVRLSKFFFLPSSSNFSLKTDLKALFVAKINFNKDLQMYFYNIDTYKTILSKPSSSLSSLSGLAVCFLLTWGEVVNSSWAAFSLSLFVLFSEPISFKLHFDEHSHEVFCPGVCQRPLICVCFMMYHLIHFR